MADAGRIGKAFRIKGELHGEEDLVIEGTVEGEITLQKHLTIESSGVINANMKAAEVTIRGEVKGNTTADSRIAITTGAKVIGDVKAPRMVIEDGAKLKGAIEMDVKLPPNV